jgi:O-methyltransferase involved in polyketide biosynthesis
MKTNTPSRTAQYMALPNTPYLSIDFNQQGLEELLRKAGVDLSIQTTLIWEGFTNYLNQKAVDAVFILAGQFPEKSSVIFTYVDRKVLEDPASFFGAERLLKHLDAIEERWTFGFHPEKLAGYLCPLGLELKKDLGAAQYREEYLSERKDILKGYEFYRVALAVLV